ncbi:uncharacterized protein [Centroberyx affinis]|uniref:uncharacterized protein n=1 Tax=Centroberyx affinis TaxID=166261 RepID=UPI003A5BA298
MDRLHIFLTVLLAAVFSCRDGTSGSELELTARPGDNITLYCDCKFSTGVYIVWFRNCSHENQPSLVVTTKIDQRNRFPRFNFVRNQSTESYDLNIENITDSDLGLYYCGTEETKVDEKEKISPTTIYRYGNVTTRILFNSSDSEPSQECPRGLCWMLLFSVCPAFAVFFSLLSVLVYHLCQKTAEEPQDHQKGLDTGGQTRGNQDEDGVCYAALDIRQASQRPKKKKAPSSDFSTYSAINTSRM